MQRRSLGRTGVRLSLIGFGGIVVDGVEQHEADAVVAAAIERGINYFDVAPAYGRAEQRLGPALAPYRNQVFLACKTGERDARQAEAELHASLRRLQTDYFDLYQLHGVSSVDEAEAALSRGGALETLVAARERGIIRHIGFSAHCEQAALRLLDAFPFDSMLLPINRFCWREGKFGPRAVAAAVQKGVGVLALKTLARRPVRESEHKRWPKCWYVPIDEQPDAMAALQFTLSLPVTAAVCPGHAELLWLMCDALAALQQRSAATELIAGEPIFAAT